jgi:hypothetical protein
MGIALLFVSSPLLHSIHTELSKCNIPCCARQVHATLVKEDDSILLLQGAINCNGQ